MTKCIAVTAIVLGLTGAPMATSSWQHLFNQDISRPPRDQAISPDVGKEPLPTGNYRVLSEPEGVRLTRPIYR